MLRFTRFFLFLALAMLLIMSAKAQTATLTDDRGKKIILEQPARRIISLSPHITELLFAAGAGEKIVAAVEYSDYPDAALNLPRIGDARRVDMERVLMHKPDLVVAWLTGNSPDDIEKLEKLGIKVYVLEISTLEETARQIEHLGIMADTTVTAKDTAKKYLARLESLREQYSGRKTLSVFYQVWHQPLMTINNDHIISDAITLCGGKNLFGEQLSVSPTISREVVLAANPQVIVDASSLNGDTLDEWRQWKMLDAVRHGNLYSLPPDLMSRATPRMLKGVQLLCEAIDRSRNN